MTTVDQQLHINNRFHM